MTRENKAYIGDSVYVESDEYGLKLTTENGPVPSNTIYLEPNVYESLIQYVERLKEKSNATSENSGVSDGGGNTDMEPRP